MWGELASSTAGSMASNAAVTSMPSVFNAAMPSMMDTGAMALTDTAQNEIAQQAVTNYMPNMVNSGINGMMINTAGMQGANVATGMGMDEIMKMGGMGLKAFGAYNDYRNKKTASDLMKNQDARANEAWNMDKEDRANRKALTY